MYIGKSWQRVKKPVPEAIMVTGSTGFVGYPLCKKINENGGQLRRALRQVGAEEGAVVGDLGPDTDFSEALDGVDAVVHLAARVHVMQDDAVDPLAEFRRVNVEGTLNLARQAAEKGVRRFVFVSSIKVNGETTRPGQPFTADDAAAPIDPYGISKYEAEQALLSLAAESEMEVAIIRPPLVYGPGVKANFLSMMRWLDKGIPLPFGAIHNQRSLVALDNLMDLILLCIEHPAAANQVFLVSDGEDMSTTELLRRTAAALGRSARLVPVPQWLLEQGLKMVGKAGLSQRLAANLQIDIGKTQALLGWVPPVKVDDALRDTATHFLKSRA